ncbi:phosphatase PAP2 family protein [Vibrio sp. SCSIO 43136]|uniref:phosphatase PAP2 family protein n=1 Tax=Vibrio sp. SCSIO 43136 TaxID=2819101 RepID=UPI00207634CB|nr:phosphatase PAP2 family protein [Vibrio sp. SCSIO 43136]USD64726.1 phosphatase PAP2 family protein [Vibrio sp. SCSIO 43136]
MQALKKVFYRDRWLYLLSVSIVLLDGLLLWVTNNWEYFEISWYIDLFPKATLVTLLIVVIGQLIYLVGIRHPSPLGFYWRQLKSLLKHWPECVNFILLSIAFSWTFSAYTSVKSAIPSILPYSMDPIFVQLDKWLHFGLSPWQISHDLFSTAYATGVINLLYQIWFAVIWLFLVGSMALVIKPKLRQSALLGFIAVWFINGTLFALPLSSVGPVFYNHIYPPLEEFSSLMNQLEEHHQWLIDSGSSLKVWSLNVQDKLWTAYSTQTNMTGQGISAMPSMHVSTTFLITLALWSFNRWAGAMGILFTLSILVGSVHLGWHYAIDGYLSLITTYCIWNLIGKLSKNQVL